MALLAIIPEKKLKKKAKLKTVCTISITAWPVTSDS